MRLVYEQLDVDGDPIEVSLGDRVVIDGEQVEVVDFEKPHKPTASGKVRIMHDDGEYDTYYVGVIGAEWIEREDQPWNT